MLAAQTPHAQITGLSPSASSPAILGVTAAVVILGKQESTHVPLAFASAFSGSMANENLSPWTLTALDSSIVPMFECVVLTAPVSVKACIRFLCAFIFYHLRLFFLNFERGFFLYLL